ncbi:MAG: helix-turn-helix domain-containing protein [Ilumatobacteraceae bacterium]
MSDRTQPPRRYDGSRREAQARETQRQVLRAAHDLFVERGYRATTIADVAEAAGVSVPTVYAGFGTKADLLRRAIEVAMAGDDDPIPVADRPTHQWVVDTDDGLELLRRYSVACGAMVDRIGRIYGVLTGAADADPVLSELLATFDAQRLTAAVWVVTAVRDRGGLPAGVDVDAARDIVWMANSPELYALTLKRGWSTERYVALVRDVLLELVPRASERTPD